jgi:hypothetical protein
LVPKSEEKRKGKLNMYMRFTTHYMIWCAKTYYTSAKRAPQYCRFLIKNNRMREASQMAQNTYVGLLLSAYLLNKFVGTYIYSPIYIAPPWGR